MKEMMKRMEDWMVSKDAQSKRLEDRMANKDIQIKRLEDQMAKKDTQIANHQARITESRAQITSLQNHVQSLTADAEGYYNIRHRFIDVYRRDVRKDATEEIRARIWKGNKKAHEGDVVVDAQLCPMPVKASNRCGPCANTKTSTRVSTIESIL